MDDDSLTCLAKLLNLLRRSGVLYFKNDGLELSLAPVEPAAPGLANHPSPTPDAPEPDMYTRLLGARGKFPGNE